MDILRTVRYKPTGMRTLLCCTMLFLLMSCSQESTNAGAKAGPNMAKKPAAKPIPVAVAKVKIGDAVDRYNTTAALEAEHHAQVLARTTGVIREILHEEGSLVKANAVLLRLENDDQLLRLKQSEIKLAQLQHEYDRRVKMKALGVVSSQEFEEIENQLETAQAEKEVAELNLSYTEVRAPFAGKIVRRLVDRGANVQPGTQLVEIMDTDPLLVRAHVPSNRLGQIAVGQKVETYLSSMDQTLEGKVSLVSPIVDPESGTVKITTEIRKYPAGTRPGDFAEVRMVTARREGAMLIPSIAVFEEQGKHVLFVVKDGKSEKRVVEVGFTDEGLTEILSGIEPDELVVSKGQRNLRNGVAVEILEGLDSEQGSLELQQMTQAAL